MKTKKDARILLITVFILAVAACAKISSPSGGPRDTTPPVVVKSIPGYRTANFKDNKIIITFDEYVVLENIVGKLIVSPPLTDKPEVMIKRKSIIVNIEDGLEDNTTYTLCFQDAVKDLNEGNKIEDFRFIFSTGPVIDSLSVTGRVFNTPDLEIPEETLVLLYHNLADTAVRTELPDYISNVDGEGYFRIDNIRPGKYSLYALNDLDNSNNYNLKDEGFAFAELPVNITPKQNYIIPQADTSALLKITVDTTTLMKEAEQMLFLFTASEHDRYLSRFSRDSKYHLVYILSRPPDSMLFEFSVPDWGEDKYFTERSSERDTLHVWLTDSAVYNIEELKTIVTYPYTDTTGMDGYKSDTIEMRYQEPVIRETALARGQRFTYSMNITRGMIRPGDPLVLESQTPFAAPDTSRIMMVEEVDTNLVKVPYLLTGDSTNSCRYILEAPFSYGKKYIFIADSSSFCNIFGECTDSLGVKFSVRNPDTFCNLTLNIENNENDLVIQLLDNNEGLIKEAYLTGNGKVFFPLLEDGLYRVRAIIDLDGDRKWTSGDYFTRRQPEPVSYYPVALEMKAGWDVVQDWEPGSQSFKEDKLRKNK